MQLIMATGIEWDLDGLTEKYRQEVVLPQRVYAPKKCIDDENIADYLSDEYFFCVIGIEEVVEMYIDYSAIHIYGVGVDCGMRLRHVFDSLPNNDIYAIKDYVDGGAVNELPREYPKNALGIEYFYGEYCMYIGYSATMPYEVPRYTKEQMDKNIHDLLAYLYGEEFAETMIPDEIYEVWLDQ